MFWYQYQVNVRFENIFFKVGLGLGDFGDTTLNISEVIEYFFQ